jgi:hypothetical protein
MGNSNHVIIAGAGGGNIGQRGRQQPKGRYQRIFFHQISPVEYCLQINSSFL